MVNNKISESVIYMSKEDLLKHVSELRSKHADMIEDYKRMQDLSSEIMEKHSDLKCKMTEFRRQKDHLRDQIVFLEKMKGSDPIYDLEHLTIILNGLGIEVLIDKIQWPNKPLRFVDRQPIKERLGWFFVPIKCGVTHGTLYSPKYAYNDFFVVGCANSMSAKAWVKMLEKRLSVFKDQNQSVVIFGEKTGHLF